MFKRVRQMRIPLAAKCELLFGAAVVMVIAAALLVPWLRLEDLTAQLNEKSAGAVARQAVADHVLRHRSTAPERSISSTQPATRPSAGVPFDGQTLLPPRLYRESALCEGLDIPKFELNAWRRFQEPTPPPFHARLDPNTGSYRFAQPLRWQQSCAQCHPASSSTFTAVAGTAEADPVPVAATQPAPLLGLVSVEIPSQISMRQLVLNRVFLLTAGLLAGTIAIIIFYVVTTRLILQPVRVLQETAEKVSQGDLNIRSDINSGDEFQVLSETFNTMLANLKSSADQLRAVNRSLDLKLGQLAESNVALYESNRLKSEFLASVSHELKTPLNSILGFAELLKEQIGAGIDSKSFRYAQNIVISGNSLQLLISDLLDLAQIEAGKMEIRSQEQSLPALFEVLVTLLKPLTEAKTLAIVTSVAPDVPILKTDDRKLQQVLYNFLSNAIKFSPSHEQIDLRAERDGQRVMISVTDRGPGIELEKQELIFEKFRQLDGGVTRQHSGTGLGLAISKELASLLGGSIGVTSSPGEGATFWIRLPLSIEAGHQDVRGRLVLT